MKDIITITFLGCAGYVGSTQAPNKDLSKYLPIKTPKYAEYKETFARRTVSRIQNITGKTSQEEHSFKEIDWLAKTLYSERHLTIPEVIPELLAIGSVILNRANDEGKSIKETVTAPRAFSGVRKKGYFGWEERPSQLHYQIAHTLLTKGVPEEYKEFRFFCNLPVVKKISPKNYRWFNKALIPLKTFPEPLPNTGQHTFFKAK